MCSSPWSVVSTITESDDYFVNLLADVTRSIKIFLYLLLCPTEECRPSRPLQLASVELKIVFSIIACSCYIWNVKEKRKEHINVCMLTYSIVLSIVLAVMCTCMICKCLRWYVDQQQDLGKPNLQ
jgi:hypothetical protein